MSQQTLPLPTILFPFEGQIMQDFRFNFDLFARLRKSVPSQAAQPTILSRTDFIHHVALHMPEVATRIEEDDFGVLHLEMGAMKLATRDAILSYEFYTVRRHFAYIAYLFEHADHELYDAIRIAYLEGLFIGETAPEYRSARSLLPARLEEALAKAERRFELFPGMRLVSYSRNTGDS